MEAHAEEASKAVKTAEKKLQNALDQTELDYPGLEPLLERLRVYAGNHALLTYFTTEQTAEQDENVLWEWHVKVNGKFKALLKSFREGEGKKKHVERRKAEKLYSGFIKASQRFYRAYIQRLAANFAEVPKVHDTARVLGEEILPAQNTKVASPELRNLLEHSCKQAVIRLGDLSRWRETELSHKERNWERAISYYKFALSLDPSNCVCYNQLAVIAAHDDNHLNAIYYMHRAATVEHFFPTAIDNLKLKSEKLMKGGSEATLGTLDMSDDIVSVLQKRLITFHAECYSRPADFVTFSQKASDVVNLIAIGFEETHDQAFDALLAKMCLINIAAEHIAHRGTKECLLQKQLSGDNLSQEIDRSCQSYFLLQRFNMMTFQALLKALSRELGEASNEHSPSRSSKKDMSGLSTTVRRVLPLLRQYSSWLLSNIKELIYPQFKSSRVAMQQVWKVYIQALNLLADSFDFMAPNPVNYLLKEDEEAASFTPFSTFVRKHRFMTNGEVKPLFDAKNRNRVPEVELHLRGVDLLLDGLRLATQKDELGINDSPLRLEGAEFVYQEIPEPVKIEVPPSPPKKLWRSRAHAQTASLNGIDSPGLQAVETTKTEQMNIIEDIKGERTPPAPILPTPSPRPEKSIASSGASTPANHSLNTPQAQTATPHRASRPPSTGLTAMDLVRQMQSSSKGGQPPQQSPRLASFTGIHSSLPSIYQSPFAPTAAEMSELASRPGTAHRASPPSSTSQQISNGIFQDQVN